MGTPAAAAPKEEPKPEPMEVELTEEEKAAKEIKDKADAAKAEGNAFYKKKQFDEAIVAYNKAIEIDPTNMAYLLNRAAAQLEKKDYDAAVEDSKKAVEVGRKNRADYAQIAKAYVRMGNAFAKKGDEFLKQALECYENAQVENRVRAVDLKIKEMKNAIKKAEARAYIDPEKALKEKEEGNEKFKGGDYPGAVKHYTEAIKRDPSSPVYYANRAAAYTKLTSFVEAKNDCEKALDIDPKYVKAWSRLGAIQFFMKEYHKSMESYQKGMDLDPENVECQQGMQRVTATIQQNSSSGKVDKERAAHGMADPEIQNILRDPVIQQVLQDFQQDPQAAQKHLQNAGIMAKLEKLIAAGVLQVG